MMNTIREAIARRQDGEKGFTLVELLVVVVILVALAAVAVPIFLSQRDKADVAALKTELSTVSNTVKNGQAIVDFTGSGVITSTAGTVSYTSEAGNQTFNYDSNLVEQNNGGTDPVSGAANITSATAAWCFEGTAGGETWHMNEDSSAPESGGCPTP